MESFVDPPQEIQSILQRFIQVYVESGKMRGRSANESHLLAYLLLHSQLSQEDLQKLSKLYYSKNGKSGISHGKIFTTLQTWEKYGVIHKTYAKEQKNRALYSLSNFTDLLKQFSQSAITSGKVCFSQIQWIKKELHTEFKHSKLKNDQGLSSAEFVERLQFIEALLSIYLNLLGYNETETLTPQKPQLGHSSVEVVQKLPELFQLSTYEEILIQIFIQVPFLQTMKEDYRKILGYIILEGTTTQKQLQIRSKLSAGQISQAIHYFLSLKLIQLKKKIGDRKNYYHIPENPVDFIEFFFRHLSSLEAIRCKFEAIYNEYIQLNSKFGSNTIFHKYRAKMKAFLDIYPEYTQTLADKNQELSHLKTKYGFN